MVVRFFRRLSHTEAAVRSTQTALYGTGLLCFCLWSSAAIWTIVLN